MSEAVYHLPQRIDESAHRNAIGNYSWGESMRLARSHWLDEIAMKRVVEEFAGENQMFGDIYARLKS